MVPARWSRNNPIDLAGGETRDTIPEVLELMAAHPDVDAIVYLGIGIQASQAQMFRSGPFWPDYGLERIGSFHESQDRRYALAAAEASRKHQKPILIASDLVYTGARYGNTGPPGVAESGRVTSPSGHRAIRTLARMVAYSKYRAANHLGGDAQTPSSTWSLPDSRVTTTLATRSFLRASRPSSVPPRDSSIDQPRLAQTLGEAARDVVGLEVAGEQRDGRAGLVGGDRDRLQPVGDRQVFGQPVGRSSAGRLAGRLRQRSRGLVARASSRAATPAAVPSLLPASGPRVPAPRARAQREDPGALRSPPHATIVGEYHAR